MIKTSAEQVPPSQRSAPIPAVKNEIKDAIVVMTVNKIGQPVVFTAAIAAALRLPHLRNS